MSDIPISDKLIRFALSVVGLPLCLAQILVSLREKFKYKPLGTMTKIGKHKIHSMVSGTGTPVVILDSGLGGCSLDWALVQPSLSELTTVVSFDRIGYGWSSGKKRRLTSQDHVDDLRNLIKKKNLKPPYILVGHSFGGLNMQLFASKYPNEVSALVLVDSVHKHWYMSEYMDNQRKKIYNKTLRLMRIGYLTSPLGIPRFFLKRHIGSQRLPAEYLKITKALGYRAKAYKAVYNEFLHVEESATQLHLSDKIPDSLPVVIISAGKQEETWKKYQMDLSKLTNNTKQIIAENSWHSIQIHDPQTVIKAIQELLIKIREE